MHFERRNYKVNIFQDLNDLHGNSKKFLLRSNMMLYTAQKRINRAPSQTLRT